VIDRSKPEAELVVCISNELDEIKKKVESLEELSTDFRKNVRIEFVDTITGRFEKLEKVIEELSVKIENYRTEIVKAKWLIDEVKIDLNNKIDKIERKRLEEKEMEVALKKLAGSEKITVNKKLLEGLKE